MTTTTCIYWIPIKNIQLKIYYKQIDTWEMYITKKVKNFKKLNNIKNDSTIHTTCTMNISQII